MSAQFHSCTKYERGVNIVKISDEMPQLLKFSNKPYLPFIFGTSTDFSPHNQLFLKEMDMFDMNNCFEFMIGATLVFLFQNHEAERGGGEGGKKWYAYKYK